MNNIMLDNNYKGEIMDSPKRLISSLDVKRLRPNNIALRDMLSTLAKKQRYSTCKNYYI